MDDWAFLVESTLQSWRAAGKPGRVLTAVSGGADSAALFLALEEISRREGFSLSCVHADHGLRPESGQDAAFVEALCRDRGVPCYVIRLSLSGVSEDAARRARYDALFALCPKEAETALALAHHRRDQMETVLMHLFRGSGGEGLGGMADVSRRLGPEGQKILLWRPFLSLDPVFIRRALRQKGVEWREDATNRRDDYLRNYLRHQVLPAIAARIPQAEEAVCRAAAILRDEEDYFRGEARAFLEKCASLAAPCRWVRGPELDALHPALRRRVLRLACPVPLDFAETEALLRATAGQTVNLPQGWRALRTEGRLHFLSPMPEPPRPGTLTALPFTGETGDGRRIQAVPKAVYAACALRFRLPGDRIRPLGGPGEKSLQDYLVDRGIDRPFRDYVPLLCRGSQVIWAVGVGPGEEARVHRDSDAVLLRYDGDLPGEPGQRYVKEIHMMNTNAALYDDLEKILVTREEIAKAVRELGQKLTRDYAGKEPVMICILKGASVFFTDLIREIDLPLTAEFMSISSYGSSTKSSGVVRILKDLDRDITGRDVLVVEDIVDSGMTLHYLKDVLRTRNAASIAIVTLLDKPARRRVELKTDYSCFNIPDAFVVGYGLDYDEKYRNLPDIGVLHPRIYSK